MANTRTEPPVNRYAARVNETVMPGAEPTYVSGPNAGVLLLHDLAGTPQPLHGLAEALCAAGMSVELPLLPGHGTDLSELDATSWDDWVSAAQLALDELASRTGPVVVGGTAMGATLACWVAAQVPEVAGVIAINPRAIPVSPDAVAMLEAMRSEGIKNVPPLGPDVSDRTAKVIAYDTVPVNTLLSMFEAIDDMADHWQDLKVPMLLINSARDHRVSPAHGDWLAERAGGEVERVVLEHSFHEATVDVDRQQLEAAAVAFVQRVTAPF